MQGFKSIVAATVFTPANPVALAYQRNASLPVRQALGQYRFTTPDLIPLQEMSITARGYNAAGNLRNVTVVPTLTGAGIQFDVFLTNDLGAATDDCVNVEVSVERLPVA